MILVIDNYDSFTYNLVQALGQFGAEVEVRRNDRIGVAEAIAMRAAGIVLSPGPGRPETAGVCCDLIGALDAGTPLLGVCLGHQAIARSCGGSVVGAPQIVHGKTTAVRHVGTGLFEGLPDPFEATRYHSLVVARADLPEVLEVTAWTRDGIIMGLRHRRRPLYGVQFHPESIATEEGPHLLSNFLGICGERPC